MPTIPTFHCFVQPLYCQMGMGGMIIPFTLRCRLYTLALDIFLSGISAETDQKQYTLLVSVHFYSYILEKNLMALKAW